MQLYVRTLVDEHMCFATAVAPRVGADAADAFSGLHEQRSRAGREIAALTATIYELNSKLTSSQQQAAQSTSRSQLQLDSTTATMIKMSQDHTNDMECMRSALDGISAENAELRCKLAAVTSNAAFVDSELEGSKAALQQ